MCHYMCRYVCSWVLEVVKFAFWMIINSALWMLVVEPVLWGTSSKTIYSRNRVQRSQKNRALESMVKAVNVKIERMPMSKELLQQAIASSERSTPQTTGPEAHPHAKDTDSGQPSEQVHATQQIGSSFFERFRDVFFSFLMHGCCSSRTGMCGHSM